MQREAANVQEVTFAQNISKHKDIGKMEKIDKLQLSCHDQTNYPELQID